MNHITSEPSLQLPPVRLRAMELEDLSTLYDIENDTSLWDVTDTNVPYSRAILLDYLSSARNDIFADKQVRLMAENREGSVVGIVDVVNFEPRHQRAEVGIVVAPAFRKRGYAKAILRQTIDYCRNIVGLHQLYSVIPEDNKASLRLFQHAGFTYETVLKDWIKWGKNYKNAYLMQLFL